MFINLNVSASSGVTKDTLDRIEKGLSSEGLQCSIKYESWMGPSCSDYVAILSVSIREDPKE